MEGANERIEEMRMGTARLKFVKPDGRPIDHKLFIKVNLIKHSFPFGIGMGQSWALFDQKKFRALPELYGRCL